MNGGPPRMICGSRSPVSRNMRRIAQWLVATAGQAGRLIVVGDAPGIDAVTVAACHRLNVSYLCYGLQDTARNGATSYVCVRSQVTASTPRDQYHQRDLLMAQYTHTHGGAVHCIWNGLSEDSGTMRLYLAARMGGYTVHRHTPRLATGELPFRMESQ